MSCIFDHVIERKGTNSLKYDFAAERGKPEDALPLWVADMDFQVPPAVVEALVKSAQHGIFGYSESKQSYFDALQKWYSQNFGWEVQKEWLVKTPGVVYAICAAIRALTKKGDAVLIQQPVYYPFSESILKNDRALINNALIYHDGTYSIDFDDFEAKIVQNSVKLFVLCSPHNPVGRVWTKAELIRMGDICVKHDVLIVSDEIHADFVYRGYRHFVFADLKPEYLDRTITCTAPSKSFNLAGLQVSNIFIANRGIRYQFKEEITKSGYSQLNTLGLVTCEAAYEHGREWLDALKNYLAQNLEFTRGFLAEKLPQIKLIEPQGTYLIWLDFSGFGLDEQRLEDLLVNKAKLWLDSGTMFGPDGKGFERINIACPRSTLEKALTQLERAVKDFL
ncbi:MAG: aminotransferase [Caproiciproducens sp.]|nr:aminotransferase [Caproiciproducens sp.]